MKSWFRIASCLSILCFLGLLGNQAIAQTQPQTQPLTQAQPVPQPAVQKDDKRTLTVLTKENKTVEIRKKDLLNDLFTPVGDVTYGIIKTTSDAVGGFCGACLDGFDAVMRWTLTPFGFKQVPNEERYYHSKFN